MALSMRQALRDEYPEFSDSGWECRECTKNKDELSKNEDSYNYLREELATLVFHLSARASYFDYHKVNSALSSMCVELGIEFDAITVDRSNAFKIYRAV